MAGVLAIVMPFSSLSDIQFALDVTTAANIRQLRADPSLPWLYQSGVRWERDVCTPAMRNIPGACEPFKTIVQGLADGLIDCDDAGPWRAAELRFHFGERARAFPKRISDTLIHILVRRGNGRVEDPSKKIGMPGGG